ncbi:MAG: ABC transporter permease [Polyangiaceae bacterium]|nr:ABC transporter permease [Polyangiaceae bacterium]MBK8938988.1 ABC transporter permease [Polyangiaceae bacterium]
MSPGAASALSTLFALIRKELLQALRDKRMMAVVLAIPIVQLTLLGFAANLELQRAHTVIVDDDRSARSRELARGLSAEGTFVTRDVATVDEAMDALRSNDATVALVIPRGFGRDVEAGVPVALQVLVDGSDPTGSVAASAALEQYASRVSLREALARLPASAGRAPRVTLEPRLLYNPSLKSRVYIVPATGASILLIVTAIITAMGLAREREVGTMEQLLVTPIHPMVLMAGKTIPYAIFGLLDQAVILVVGNVVFDVPLRGPIPVLMLSAVVYLTSTLGLGLVVGALSRTQQQALMGAFFIILPAILLSGMMTPVEAMPGWVQPITWVNPARYYIEILRSILLRGAGLEDIARPLAHLAGLAIAFMALAVVRFKRALG